MVEGNVVWSGCHLFLHVQMAGRRQYGQIWKYIPSQNEGEPSEVNDPGILELFIEPNNVQLIDGADNITVATMGRPDHLRGWR